MNRPVFGAYISGFLSPVKQGHAGPVQVCQPADEGELYVFERSAYNLPLIEWNNRLSVYKVSVGNL